MTKSVIIAVLFVLCSLSLWVAVRNTKPVCDDIVYHRSLTQQDEFVCEYGLGDVTAQQARSEVIMRFDR